MGFSDHLLSVGTAFSVLFLLFSIYYRETGDDELKSRLVNVIDGLIEVEIEGRRTSPISSSPPSVPARERIEGGGPKVAVGYGACVDLLVDGSSVLDYRSDIEPRHHDSIDNLDQLVESFAHYFQHGAATERYMTNATLFDSLVATAELHPSARYKIGGNAAVIAMRLHAEGCQVLLASTLSSRHISNIPRGIKVVGGSVQRDDIHLVLEYKSGEKWGPFTAPRANRFILHNDVHNPRLKSLNEFEWHLRGYHPDLFIVSGLQLMDNLETIKDSRQQLLVRVKNQILALPKSSKVHFEMASFTEIPLLQQLQKDIIPYCDSLGMNEQELTNLYHLYKYGNITTASNSAPRVASVLDEMRFIFRELNKSYGSVLGGRPVTRIHVHTLAFQAVMTDTESSWRQTDVAAAKASLTAYRHVCASPKVDANRATILMDDGFALSSVVGSDRVAFEPKRPVSCWHEDNNFVCVAAGLVCTHAEQTAGGGDNISAAALAAQL